MNIMCIRLECCKCLPPPPPRTQNMIFRDAMNGRLSWQASSRISGTGNLQGCTTPRVGNLHYTLNVTKSFATLITSYSRTAEWKWLWSCNGKTMPTKSHDRSHYNTNWFAIQLVTFYKVSHSQHLCTAIPCREFTAQQLTTGWPWRTHPLLQWSSQQLTVRAWCACVTMHQCKTDLGTVNGHISLTRWCFSSLNTDLLVLLCSCL